MSSMTMTRCATSLDFLLGSADFHVTLFESAQNFLDALPTIDFGCVVSDVRMPGIDGIELLKRLKAGGSLFPVVIMTGHGDVPLAVEAMKLGAMDFLEKPFEDDRLIGMIEAALKQAEPGMKSEAVTSEIQSRIASLSPRERQVMDGLDRRTLEQADCARVRHQSAHDRGLPGQRDDQDAGSQPLGTRAAGDARRRIQRLSQVKTRPPKMRFM